MFVLLALKECFFKDSLRLSLTSLKSGPVRDESDKNIDERTQKYVDQLCLSVVFEQNEIDTSHLIFSGMGAPRSLDVSGS